MGLGEAVLTSTHNLCFVQKYDKNISFLSENFQFLAVKFSIYLNRRVFVMYEPGHSISDKISCAHSKDSDQHVHMCSAV